MRRALVALGMLLAVVVTVVVGNTLRFAPHPVAVEPAPPLRIASGLAERLAAAIRYRTVSFQDPAQVDAAQFEGLHRHLTTTYPRVHAALEREVVGGQSLLYTWGGRDPGMPPLLLLAHQDVVPVDPATAGRWTHPAFDGVVADGFVWGRGALDDKLGVIGLLEAVEALLAEGFRPERAVLLAFGHDEEVGGRAGAVALAAHLAARQVKPAFVLDEGLSVTVGVVSGVPRPLALVGVAEKGYLSLELVVTGEGGHSSRPPPETAVGILARAIDRLETRKPRPALTGTVAALLAAAGPEMDLAHRAVLANLWLFRPLVVRHMVTSPELNALVRTTTAPTMLEGSIKENVLPVRARAVINFRIRPGESIADTTEHARRAIADPRVTLTALTATLSEPSPESPVDGAAFAAIARSIRQVYPEAAVAPSLVVGATDSRHYLGLTPDVYRFLPVHVRPEDQRRLHGIDERVSVDDLDRAVRFYAQLMRNAGGAP